MAQSKPRLRSSTVGGTRTYDGGISSQSLVKPSSVGHGTHLFNNKASLASKLFEFYDKTVAETELMVEAIDLPDGATNSAKITGAKRILRNARIPSRMRHNMTGEVFWSKAERVIEVRERIQFKDLSLLPPRPPTYVHTALCINATRRLHVTLTPCMPSIAMAKSKYCNINYRVSSFLGGKLMWVCVWPSHTHYTVLL